MQKTKGIIVFGANGSGKTTLGRELAHVLGFKHMDIEDYYFEESEIPYTVQRSKEECLRLMHSDIIEHGSFVISAVTGNFGEMITKFYDLAIFVKAPQELRIKRVKERAYMQYGNRVCKGGDMYEENQKFIDFVSNRDLSIIEQWADTLTCPVIHVDGTMDWRKNAIDIAMTFKP